MHRAVRQRLPFDLIPLGSCAQVLQWEGQQVPGPTVAGFWTAFCATLLGLPLGSFVRRGMPEFTTPPVPAPERVWR